MEDLRSIDVNFYFLINGKQAVKVGFKNIKEIENLTIEKDNIYANEERKKLAKTHNVDISKIVRISEKEYEKFNNDEDVNINKIEEDSKNIVMEISFENGLKLEVDTGTTDMIEAMRIMNEEDYKTCSVISATMFGAKVYIPKNFLQDYEECGVNE
ncbi:hypothetical protein HMPREF1143_0195 [Peptoanaerobacter stomatis]|uniref:Uncharacterized protein n=1 Tax=Peptoanaerobacter stomatis TaxID=796937 RepID=J5WFM2_9FIRM|nr:hypothetical protein [Peptoanaerobacter stomatis]EJU21602.1 hypothetical protein HMPREF1143_0195 [Peptoanaerobacter stomatis]